MSGNRKTERLFNLLIMLLVQRRFVSKERIREILYPGQTTDAFEKMFERDKEELRSLGVPIEVGGMDVYFDDEPGYRIRPDQLALPEISLSADEAAVVGLATKVWEHAKLAAATTEAVRKLTAYGVSVDVGALDIGEARIGAEEPSFDVFWAAALERTPVTFDYRRVGARAQPPGTSSRGAWCASRGAGTPWAGTPTGRTSGSSGSPGSQGAARLDGEPGSYRIPPGTDVRAIAERLAPTAPSEPATVLVRPGGRSAAAPSGHRGHRGRRRPRRRGVGPADAAQGHLDERGAAQPRARPRGRGAAVAPRRRGRPAHRRGGCLVSTGAGRGQGPGRPAAAAGAVPACPPGSPPRRGRPGARGAPAAGARRPQGAADVRAARRLPRRPDRRGPRRARERRGRRGDPGEQRRLPGPAAAADAHRGERADRGAPGAARGRRRLDP